MSTVTVKYRKAGKRHARVFQGDSPQAAQDRALAFVAAAPRGTAYVLTRKP